MLLTIWSTPRVPCYENRILLHKIGFTRCGRLDADFILSCAQCSGHLQQEMEEVTATELMNHGEASFWQAMTEW
ncbi:hypothetical protein LSAT2_013661 [Lamellibrachia satsuma]|nr:hypothetical protein LSAT2_013661 [Lamellibrachia satsuma]